MVGFIHVFIIIGTIFFESRPGKCIGIEHIGINWNNDVVGLDILRNFVI
jgi:hypothetical protein